MTMRAFEQQACTGCNCALAFGPQRMLARRSALYRKPITALNVEVSDRRLQKGRSDVHSFACIRS